MEGEICKKCGVFYQDPSEGFYWEKRKDGWRKPCKVCIKNYNDLPKQKRNRLKAHKRYRKTDKGKLATKAAQATRMKRYYRNKEQTQ